MEMLARLLNAFTERPSIYRSFHAALIQVWIFFFFSLTANKADSSERRGDGCLFERWYHDGAPTRPRGGIVGIFSLLRVTPVEADGARMAESRRGEGPARTRAQVHERVLQVQPRHRRTPRGSHRFHAQAQS